ncbi:MAG: hypothetical protein OEY41_09690 [Acidimicrobiia bacterium]|nr:hypothetical protein [Acidimicrobiia bacterium]
MAGALVAAMLAEGVDLGDSAAIEQWMEEFNARPFAERALVLSDDVFDEGPPLPAVTVPDEMSARGSAAGSPLLGWFRGLVDFVGEGRKVTQTGNLTLADARQLVALLGTGDRFDERIGDRTFKTKSASDLPQLSFVVRLAAKARVVRVVKGRMVSTKAGRDLGRDPLADLQRLVDAICDLGLVTARTSGGRYVWSALAPFFDDLFLPLASMLLTAEDGVAFDAIVERASEEFEAEVHIDNPYWTDSFRHDFVESEMRTAIATLEAAGVVSWDSEIVIRHRSEIRVGGTVALTPAGRWTVHRHLAESHDLDLPVARPAQFTDLGFEAMIGACEAADFDDVAHVMREIMVWCDRRGEAALPELVLAAGSTTDPGVRNMALAVLGEQFGPEAEPAVRGLLEVPACRGSVLLWLVDHEFEAAEALLDPDPAVFAEVLALVLVSRGPDEMVEVFEHVGNHDVQLALVQDMARIPSPEVGLVLVALGRDHPTARIAKAARKEAMQNASRQANRRR